MIPRIGRWWLAIQEFTSDVEYRPGTKIGHADTLSRNPIPDTNAVHIHTVNTLTRLDLACQITRRKM